MKKILLTGANGYIGGRLLTTLEKEGYTVRCMVRNPVLFKDKFSGDRDIIKADTLKPETLTHALDDIDTAFYLIHAMGSQGHFEEEDRLSAQNFANAAKQANVKKIIYLGGLIPSDESLSPHLKSRLEVGEILRSSGINVITFRASIIIGSGSLSFELIRNLSERLPFMITPKWIYLKAQPISITNVISYLVQGVKLDVDKSYIFEIGGKEVVSYFDIIKIYCDFRELKRFIIPVPFLTPYFSSLWLSFVTPLYARIGKKLIESIRHATIVEYPEQTQQFFNITPMTVKEAVQHAMQNEEQEFSQTHWADSYSSVNRFNHSWQFTRFGNRLVYSREIDINVPIKTVFHKIQTIGGKNGWYYANWLWKLRGMIDIFFGGAGHKRGRRDPVDLRVGDHLDWWRVEQIEKNKLLRLYAEMKLPGRGWLEFELKEERNITCLYVSSIFDPIGVFGRLYWYFLYPLHFLVFSGMMNAIKKMK